MELYLDSANLQDIEEAFQLGILDGLTTTPTFMQKEGITDVDAMIVKLSKIVPVLQIEALGDTAEEILAEAQRQLDLGLDKSKTVFKIPVSLEGVKACRMLRNEGMMVNVHLVYTLQQAYMAMHAGATYVCPLVGRLQDQGHDALSLVAQIVDAVNYYGYDTKVMFSSVRNVEHVRNAVNLGVQTITVPLPILKKLTENNMTTLGTQQFETDTRLMTKKVSEVMKDSKPAVNMDSSIKDATVAMSSGGFGAVAVVDGNAVKGIFTDGDLRRYIQADGKLDDKISSLDLKAPLSVQSDALLNDAKDLFKNNAVDTLIVMNGDDYAGMIDIQQI